MNREECSFIIEFDEMTNKQMNSLADFFNDNKIKYQVLKSNYELKKEKKLEQALDDIEKICNGIPIENSICDIGKIHDIEVIIQKAKGDVKNENNNI